jgi:hypothetical protein
MINLLTVRFVRSCERNIEEEDQYVVLHHGGVPARSGPCSDRAPDRLVVHCMNEFFLRLVSRIGVIYFSGTNKRTYPNLVPAEAHDAIAYCVLERIGLGCDCFLFFLAWLCVFFPLFSFSFIL